MSARDELREYADRYGYTAHVNALIDAVVAEALTGAADKVAELIEDGEHDPDALVDAILALTPAPVESAGDETGEGCACGPQMRCAKGHCSRHDMCQDCGNCCSCKCATGGAA